MRVLKFKQRHAASKETNVFKSKTASFEIAFSLQDIAYIIQNFPQINVVPTKAFLSQSSRRTYVNEIIYGTYKVLNSYLMLPAIFMTKTSFNTETKFNSR